MLLLVVPAACSDASAGETDDSGPVVLQPGAPGEESTELSREYLEALEPLPHIQADIDFMQMMIVHHRQALEMTAMVEERSDRDDIPMMARRMRISQGDEIVQMEEWLEERLDEPADGWGHDHEEEAGVMTMAGYLTDDQLAELEAARGEEFDRLFLEFMTYHHEGALEMIVDLQEAGGAQEPTIGAMTNHFYADQEIEILRMQRLLEEMDGDATGEVSDG